MKSIHACEHTREQKANKNRKNLNNEKLLCAECTYEMHFNTIHGKYWVADGEKKSRTFHIRLIRYKSDDEMKKKNSHT